MEFQALRLDEIYEEQRVKRGELRSQHSHWDMPTFWGLTKKGESVNEKMKERPVKQKEALRSVELASQERKAFPEGKSAHFCPVLEIKYLK